MADRLIKAGLVVWLGVLLMGCASATPTAAPSPAPSATTPATLAPSATSAPTDTSTPQPTATPDVPFSQTGPWLLFLATSKQTGPATLWAVNADGTALRQVVPEPVYQFAVRPQRNASGQVEIAYITSTTDQGLASLTLNMLTLPDGKTRLITALTSKEISLDNAATGHSADISQGLIWSVHIVWSPDSRWLAFGGAQDGPSIDVYSYDANSTEVQRLTSGAGHAGNFTWTPDSRYIVHTSFECYACEGDSSSGLWAARPDGSGVLTLEDPADGLGAGILEQISPGRFLLGRASNGSNSDLRLVSLTGDMVRYPQVCDSYFWTVVAAPDDQIALVHMGNPGCRDADKVGWYLMDAKGQVSLISTAPDGYTIWDPGDHIFMIHPNDPDLPFAVTSAGKIVAIPAVRSFPSPDGKTVFQEPLGDSAPAGQWISKIGAEPYQVPGPLCPPYVSWSPDSLHFECNFSNILMVASSPDFVPAPISGGLSCPSDAPGCGFFSWNAAWTP